MKTYKGKAIYNPSGKAGEYSYWACNFYTGCSNNCAYCYCKRGVMSSTWSTTPKLKSCFKSEDHALEVFEKELKQNLSELQEHGLFFTFTSDPMLPGTFGLTFSAINICQKNNVPVKTLTKYVGGYVSIDDSENWVNSVIRSVEKGSRKTNGIAFGFTLTGHDELEPNANTNAERIEAMRKLHDAGFKTWASIEPVIDFDKASRMIQQTIEFCDLYKIGLMSGKKYNREDVIGFYSGIQRYFEFKNPSSSNPLVYWKDSIFKAMRYNRDSLTSPVWCVGRDYNIFKENH